MNLKEAKITLKIKNPNYRKMICECGSVFFIKQFTSTMLHYHEKDNSITKVNLTCTKCLKHTVIDSDIWQNSISEFICEEISVEEFVEQLSITPFYVHVDKKVRDYNSEIAEFKNLKKFAKELSEAIHLNTERLNFQGVNERFGNKANIEYMINKQYIAEEIENLDNLLDKIEGSGKK